MTSEEKNDEAESRASDTRRQLIFTAPLTRLRRAHGSVRFTVDELHEDPATDQHPSRAAQMLALAHEFQRLIDEGEGADRATLAEQVGITRARLTQIMDLLLLAPDIQEAVLVGEVAQQTERCLRKQTRLQVWKEQRLAMADMSTFVDSSRQ